jgi:GT2 family glycosyltransferase
MKFDLIISIVLYKPDVAKLSRALDSIEKTTLNYKLMLVDNSPTDDMRVLQSRRNVEYLFNNANLGFGKAHNIAMRRSIAEARYHLVLNPDIYFDEGILEKIFLYMEQHPDVGQVMPKILYPSGEIQRLCKLLPAPADLFLRRFFPWWPGAEKRNANYELQGSGYDKIMNIPYLSGCFMFLRSSSLADVGLFDERIFMYIEDADLTRRVHYKYKTLFYPETVVYHYYHKGSYKNFRLMWYNIHGAMIYFTKWGWFFDKDRKKINQQVLDAYVPHS